ncbi:MAG: hypothetical protein R3E87_14630 [Burkholderiaceae bacterium]
MAAQVDDARLLAHARLIILLVKGMMRRAAPLEGRAPSVAESAALAELVLHTIDDTFQSLLGKLPGAAPGVSS